MTKKEIAITLVGTANMKNLNLQWKKAVEELAALETCQQANEEQTMFRGVEARSRVHRVGFMIKMLEGGKLPTGDFWSEQVTSEIKRIDPENTAEIIFLS